jgi:flavodoxin
MKTLIVYYSRSGTTKRVAEELAERLGCDIDGITEPHGRGGLLGYLRSGYEAKGGKRPSINPPGRDPSQYDLVVVGTPVWGGNVSSPVRSYLSQHGEGIRSVAFFCTMGGSDPGRTFPEMEACSGRKPVETLALQGGRIESEDAKAKVKAFADALKPQDP